MVDLEQALDERDEAIEDAAAWAAQHESAMQIIRDKCAELAAFRAENKRLREALTEIEQVDRQWSKGFATMADAPHILERMDLASGDFVLMRGRHGRIAAEALGLVPSE